MAAPVPTQGISELPGSKSAAIEEFAKALKSESKLSRKTALEKFHSHNFSEDLIQPLEDIFSLANPYVLRSLADESEACRAAGIKILESFVAKLDLTDYHLAYVVPALVRRVGCPDIVEEAEELRLVLVQLVHKIIIKCQSNPQVLDRYFNDFTSILCKTAADPFPDVRVVAGACIVLLAGTLKMTFRQQAESFIKPLLPSLTHQRFKVRVAAVDSIGAVVLYGTGKCMELCVTPLAEKLFDEVEAVRRGVLRAVASWMLLYNDRYSFWHRMIPLILTGLSDWSSELRSEAQAQWNRIGEQFALENEQDLKKEMDFLELPGEFELYPDIFPVQERPNIGCRVLVQRNIGKIVPAIVRECEGWQADARLRSVQLLGWLLVCAEEGATQHARVVLECLRRAARDDDPRVLAATQLSSQEFGYFISPDTWWPLLKPELDSWAGISVLAHVISGAKASALKIEMMREICREIACPDRCQSIRIQQQAALLSFMSSVLQKFVDCVAVEDELFTVSFTVYAMSDPEMRSRARKELESLCRTLYKTSDMRDMYARHALRTLEALTSHPASWSAAAPDFLIFYTIITDFGGGLLHVLPEVSRVLARSLGEPQLEPAVRVKLFTALSALLLAKHTHFQQADPRQLTDFFNVLLREVILPNLVWAPGLTAETVRCAAASCLCCLLQAEPDRDQHTPMEAAGDQLTLELEPEGETLRVLSEQVAPLLPALLDDRNNVTRRRALAASASAARLLARCDAFPPHLLHQLNCVVLKRLDDSCEEVRALAVRCLVTLFQCRPPDYDRVTFNAHIDALYSTMLIHLDDVEESVRRDVLKALTELSDLDPELLMRKVKANTSLYRNKAAFEALEHNIRQLLG